MALIYKIEFPNNIFLTARNIEGFSTTGLGVYTSNFVEGTQLTGLSTKTFSLADLRNYVTPQGIYTIPKEDITSTDLKVSTRLEENKSKVTYDFGLIGVTAQLIVQYLNYVRLPAGSNAYPAPKEGIEYLFSLDKQIKITITDDCCYVPQGNRSVPKTVLNGYIPLNTVRYCLDKGCSLNCTIYEDTARTDAIKCIESTVLGVKSNVGILATAEVANDKLNFAQTNVNTSATFARVPGKWFDMCVEPQSTGLSFIILDFLGLFRFILFPPLVVLFSVIILIVRVINLIISAINLIPGINIVPIDAGGIGGGNPFEDAVQLTDDLLGGERMVEGLLGCKYIRGGYRVSSIIKSVCSICDFTKEKFRDFTLNNNVDLDDFSQVKTPVSYNPFVPYGNAATLVNNVLLDTFNTVYIPAEEAFTRREETKLVKSQQNTTTEAITKVQRRVANRAASIETVDKIFNRLGTLWGTGWDVVTTPEGIQLQIGSLEGRYIFDRTEFVDTTSSTKRDNSIQDGTVCYDVGKGSPIGYQTNWKQDSSDTSANKQLQNYRGYVSYQNPELKDRKPKEIKTLDVDLSPTHYIGSLKDDSVYDDLIAKRERVTGYRNLDEYFEKGQMINSNIITSSPKLVQFELANTRVIDSGRAARVKDHNQVWLGARRMADYVDTFLAQTTIPTIGVEGLLYSPNKPYPIPTGLQNLIPHFSLGYYGQNKPLSSNNYSDEILDYLVQDYLLKYGSENVGYDEALAALRDGSPSFLGVFLNTVTGREILLDSQTYNFAPLMEFTFEKENFACGEEDLMNQCLTSAVVKKENSPLYETNDPCYKLRLMKLSQGLGVVTELEIDYKNRNIKASGYVIPFFQVGIDYSIR